MTSPWLCLACAVGGLAWAACAAPQAESGGGVASAAPKARTAAPAPAGPAAAWHTLSHEERKAYMQAAVLPTMEPLFTAHDAERFGAFGCRTCHGARARERAFAMPNPELPTLYPTGSAEQRATVERHREIARFMHREVTPGMRRLLGAEPYDPATGRGFSCFRCHPRGEPSAPADGEALP